MPKTVHDLERLLLSFVDRLQEERNISRYTCLAYLNDLRQFVRFIDEGGWHRTWAGTLAHFEQYQKRRNFLDSTIKRRIYVARNFADFCKEKNLGIRDWDFIRNDSKCRHDEWPVLHETALSHLSVQSAVDIFISEVQRLRSANTAKAYRVDLRGFARFFAELSPGAITRPSIEEYLFGLTGQTSTIRRTAAAIQAFCRWALVQGVLYEDPSGGLSGIRTFSKKEDPPEELPAVNEAFGKTAYTAFPERDDLIMDLLYTYALRPHEIVGVKVGQLNLEMARLDVGSRAIEIAEHSVKLIQRYLPLRSVIEKDATLIVNRRGTGLTTRSLGRIVKEYAVKLGLSAEAHPMQLRRAGIARSADSGVEMELTMRRVGSFSREILELYK